MKDAEWTPGASRRTEGSIGPAVAGADADADACFHCGLPLRGAVGFTVPIAGRAREMCCAGCRAVAQAIVDGGLERYYTHRESMPASAAEAMPPPLAQLLLYEAQVVAAGLVESAGICVPRRVNGIMAGQPRPCRRAFEDLLNRSPCHVPAGVAR